MGAILVTGGAGYIGIPRAVDSARGGRPFSVLEVISSVERVTGLKVPRELSGRRPGGPAVLFAWNGRASAELAWTPRLGDLETLVEPAWRWHAAHPHGFEGVAD